MKIQQISIAVCILFFLSGLPLFAYETNFFRTLYKGMSGGDVKELQVILNSDLSTKVAEYGPGSPGNETYYFGDATEKAVKNFQQKYKSEILAPNNLSYPTGIVGNATIAKLKGLQIKSEASVPSTAQSMQVSVTKPVLIQASSTSLNLIKEALTAEPIIFGVTPQIVKPGQSFLIGGYLIDAKTVVKINSNDLKSCVVERSGLRCVTPSGLADGEYTISIMNGKSIAKTKPVIEISKDFVTPTVERVSPVSQDGIVELRGVGLSGGKVYGGYFGEIALTNCDSTCTFKVRDFPKYSEIMKIKQDAPMVVPIVVMVGKAMSNMVSFTLQ